MMKKGERRDIIRIIHPLRANDDVIKNEKKIMKRREADNGDE